VHRLCFVSFLFCSLPKFSAIVPCEPGTPALCNIRPFHALRPRYFASVYPQTKFQSHFGSRWFFFFFCADTSLLTSKVPETAPPLLLSLPLFKTDSTTVTPPPAYLCREHQMISVHPPPCCCRSPPVEFGFH